MRLFPATEDAEPAMLDWLARSFGVHVLHQPRHLLGVLDDTGVLVGVFVVTWRCDTTAELHVYGRISIDTVKAMFRTVFDGWNVYRLEIRTMRANRRVRRAAPKYGFRFESIAKSYYGPGNDAFCYAMTADKCRWLKEG
jgi:RimJ/RimL family protein N-acetyltransferase